MKSTIAAQGEVLSDVLADPLARLAEKCSAVWGDRGDVNGVMAAAIKDLHRSTVGSWAYFSA